MKKTILNIIFILGIFVFLLSGLAKTVVFPKDINYYENRKAVRLEKPSIKAFLEGKTQDNAEDAIADQAFFAQRMKKTYNTTVSKYMNLVLSPIGEKYPKEYIRLGEYYLFDRDNLIFPPYNFARAKPEADARIDSFNKLFLKYPDIDFYTYYIEKDTDINFKDNSKVGIAEYYRQRLNLPDKNMGVYEINDFETFDKYFYKTDHHWNAQGSYEGYKNAVKLLIPDETDFLKAEGIIDVKGDFLGSKTLSEETALYSENFSAYKINYPETEIYINGVKTGDYGNQDTYVFDEITYSNFYGGDMGEIIFDTGRKDRDNLLIVGESFDNAILKAVASHFNRTVSIDMRYYKNYMGRDFSFSNCLSDNNIQKVLFIGNVDYFVSDVFEVEK